MRDLTDDKPTICNMHLVKETDPACDADACE
jgi:hypothetical protein